MKSQETGIKGRTGSIEIKCPFTYEEIRCNCGCGSFILNTAFFRMLLTARFTAGIPFVIRSWTRCPDHNRAEGGVADSSHLRGLAVDIATRDSHERFVILRALMQAGFPRFGIHANYIHVSNNPDKPSGIAWLY